MNSVVMPRYLTKSRFKLALECPTKLFYTGKLEVYALSSMDKLDPVTFDRHAAILALGTLGFDGVGMAS
jgi:hypothetical protein